MDEKFVEYEIKIKHDVTPLSEGKKKALTSSCGKDNHVKAAYFIMHKLLSEWRRHLLLDPGTKPEPTSGPEIIACRLFSFVERSEELITFVRKVIQKRKVVRKTKKLSSRRKQDNF